jgi:hypothetical protein
MISFSWAQVFCKSFHRMEYFYSMVLLAALYQVDIIAEVKCEVNFSSSLSIQMILS